MRNPRIHTPQPLAANVEIRLEAEASQHLVQVLRLRTGAEITLFNGDGRDYPAILLNEGKRGCRALIQVQGPEEPPASLNLSLAIGISKGERMDMVMQKAVELGVSRIRPLFTRRSVVQLAGDRLEKRMGHWHKVMLGACEQSGRSRLPELGPAMGFDDWLGEEKVEGLGLLLHPDGKETLSSLTPPRPGQAVEILVGPEGGLTEEESSQAIAAGFLAVRLGPRVLRTETAPLAAIAAMQMLWGDFRD
ncbi:MAG: 16S rRNA (uracil(1498)-N(3))-methyltransferase [Gammaproteobacteria bacterium]|nr:16S rRNA (uracil(1498)-N(3))-methyltransferase [Gammaproteobacteria bacterium]MBU1653266.1 16S rRNA (uracil(1498)-N(3))-methyltransferase [Gammaproteobacteria bacterium]MBU1961492.1 16S rRNA (uracil(1498)-N(3))-methyltransferase [Gammaproteobacteria bacterium]